jgi:tRNA pseudouridine65 synthase
MQDLRDQLGQHVFPIHRLDRGTSGIVLFALSSEAASAIGQDFQQHKVEKSYLAVVRGWLPEVGRIDYPLEKDGSGVMQEAITTYQRLATAELPIPVDRYATARYSLAEIKPLTGRMHQIRRHFAHLRHPILADRKRGDRHHNHMWETQFEMTTMQLLAWRLQFKHPFSGEILHIQTEPDAEMQRCIFDILGWKGILDR